MESPKEIIFNEMQKILRELNIQENKLKQNEKFPLSAFLHFHNVCKIYEFY